MTTPTRWQVIEWAKEAGIDAESDTLCRHEGWLEPITQLCAIAMSAGREQGLREAKEVCEARHANGNRKYTHADECAAAIEQLRAKQEG